jgi:hypothetical protein
MTDRARANKSDGCLNASQPLQEHLTTAETRRGSETVARHRRIPLERRGLYQPPKRMTSHPVPDMARLVRATRTSTAPGHDGLVDQDSIFSPVTVRSFEVHPTSNVNRHLRPSKLEHEWLNQNQSCSSINQHISAPKCSRGYFVFRDFRKRISASGRGCTGIPASDALATDGCDPGFRRRRHRQGSGRGPSAV